MKMKEQMYILPTHRDAIFKKCTSQRKSVESRLGHFPNRPWSDREDFTTKLKEHLESRKKKNCSTCKGKRKIDDNSAPSRKKQSVSVASDEMKTSESDDEQVEPKDTAEEMGPNFSEPCINYGNLETMRLELEYETVDEMIHDFVDVYLKVLQSSDHADADKKLNTYDASTLRKITEETMYYLFTIGKCPVPKDRGGYNGECGGSCNKGREILDNTSTLSLAELNKCLHDVLGPPGIDFNNNICGKSCVSHHENGRRKCRHTTVDGITHCDNLMAEEAYHTAWRLEQKNQLLLILGIPCLFMNVGGRAIEEVLLCALKHGTSFYDVVADPKGMGHLWLMVGFGWNTVFARDTEKQLTFMSQRAINTSHAVELFKHRITESCTRRFIDPPTTKYKKSLFLRMGKSRTFAYIGPHTVRQVRDAEMAKKRHALSIAGWPSENIDRYCKVYYTLIDLGHSLQTPLQEVLEGCRKAIDKHYEDSTHHPRPESIESNNNNSADNNYPLSISYTYSSTSRVKLGLTIEPESSIEYAKPLIKAMFDFLLRDEDNINRFKVKSSTKLTLLTFKNANNKVVCNSIIYMMIERAMIGEEMEPISPELKRYACPFCGKTMIKDMANLTENQKYTIICTKVKNGSGCGKYSTLREWKKQQTEL